MSFLNHYFMLGPVVDLILAPSLLYGGLRWGESLRRHRQAWVPQPEATCNAAGVILIIQLPARFKL